MIRDTGESIERIASAVEAEVDEGWTLPASWYTDPRVFEREQQRIFSQTWQYAGSASRVVAPGSYFTCTVGRIPVVVVRGRDDILRAFVNVCRHRGHLIASGAGVCSSLQCPYHAWTYNLNGSLRSAPRSNREQTFDPSALSLRELRLEAWGPLLFVNPDIAAASLNVALGDLPALAERRRFDLSQFSHRASRRWEIACNWKVTVDNNTECYHCATIHRGFASDYFVDSGRYHVTSFPQAFSHDTAMRRGTNSGAAPDFHLYYLWPNFMASARRDEYFYTYVYLPAGPELTIQLNEYFCPADWSDERVDQLIDDIAQIMREDWQAFESVQSGLRSGAIERGRILVQEEALLRQFQKLCAHALAGV